MTTDVVVAETIARLEMVLAAVESGELPAEPDQIAWLRGAVAGLRAVVERSVSEPR